MPRECSDFVSRMYRGHFEAVFRMLREYTEDVSRTYRGCIDGLSESILDIQRTHEREWYIRDVWNMHRGCLVEISMVYRVSRMRRGCLQDRMNRKAIDVVRLYREHVCSKAVISYQLNKR